MHHLKSMHSEISEVATPVSDVSPESQLDSEKENKNSEYQDSIPKAAVKIEAVKF